MHQKWHSYQIGAWKSLLDWVTLTSFDWRVLQTVVWASNIFKHQTILINYDEMTMTIYPRVAGYCSPVKSVRWAENAETSGSSRRIYIIEQVKCCWTVKLFRPSFQLIAFEFSLVLIDQTFVNLTSSNNPLLISLSFLTWVVFYFTMWPLITW